MGVLTDGKRWLLRWPGAGEVRLTRRYAFTLDSADSGTPSTSGCGIPPWSQWKASLLIGIELRDPLKVQSDPV